MFFDAPLLISILQLVWINILLSGDNAVVIALACNGLPASQRRIGIILGAAVAVGLRIVFTFLVTYLLDTPFLRLAGGLLLLWIAVKLIVEDGQDHGQKISSSDRLFHAVRTVAIADIVMSLDNVLAIAAIAKDNTALLVLGLLISVPLIVAGSGLVMYILKRFPILIWAGAALLGWVAGDMLLADPALVQVVDTSTLHMLELPAGIVGALSVIACSYVLRHLREKQVAVNDDVDLLKP